MSNKTYPAKSALDYKMPLNLGCRHMDLILQILLYWKLVAGFRPVGISINYAKMYLSYVMFISIKVIV